MKREAFAIARIGAPYFNDYGTIGYSIATQTPDGLIHLIGSMTHPSQEFELNEAWILSDAATVTGADEKTGPIKVSEERYASGATKSTTRGAVDSDGVFRLEGKQVWYFESGHGAYTAEYRRGHIIGLQICWASPGVKKWTWMHQEGRRPVFGHNTGRTGTPNGFPIGPVPWRRETHRNLIAREDLSPQSR